MRNVVFLILYVSFLPSLLTAQRSTTDSTVYSRQQTMELYLPHEFRADEYIPVHRSAQETSPPYRMSRPGFSVVQVNVDSNGRNIVGDAANEPSIAVSRVDRTKMAIGWRQFDTITSNFRQAGYAYTTDEGRTWTFPGVLDSGLFRSDPVLDSDTEGNFFYYSLAVDPDYFCRLFKDSTGGANWDDGVYAYGGDKAWMSIDLTDSIGRNNLYFAWDHAGCCNNDWFTRSADHGFTFDAPGPIPGQPIWGTTATGPDGAVYVAGRSLSTNEEFYVARSSTVQDSSSGLAFDFAVQVDMGGAHQFAIGIGPNPGGLQGQAWIAADFSSGPTAGNLYLLCSVDPPGDDPLDVHFVRSTDGGATWTVPIRINDDSTMTAWQWFGTLSVAPNGRIDVCWLDTRNGPGVYSALFYSYSTDGGNTWSANEQLSDSFDPHLGWPNQSKLGDYFDMVSDNDGADLAWAATFTGGQDVYYSRIDAPATGVDEDGRPLRFSLSQNYPNPFNPKTRIVYSVGSRQLVVLSLFNLLGQEVAILVNETKDPGSYPVEWDATGFPSGVYYYRLQTAGHIETKKLVLLR